MTARPKIDHMERLGLKTNPLINTVNGMRLRNADVASEILGRRSRKVWECAAGDACSVKLPIDLDEVYIEHSHGPNSPERRLDRYHVACAITKKLVLYVEHAVDQGNSRRQAVLAQRARREANAD